MTDKPVTAAATDSKSDSSSSGPTIWGVSIGTVITTIIGAIGSVAGAGPYGAIAIAALGILSTIGGVLGYNYLVKKWNKKVDTDDLNSSGADSGNTAVGLANQGAQVNNNLDNMQNYNPPRPPGTTPPKN